MSDEEAAAALVERGSSSDEDEDREAFELQAVHHGERDELIVLEHPSHQPKDTITSFVVQVFPSLMIAGFGMVAAGSLLDVVQHWDLFIEVSELFILVPALLGLKGNLEMTLASRLSTAAHRGELSDHRCWPLVTSNLLLVQIQAITVGFAAAIFSVLMGVIFHHEFSIRHVCLLLASSIATASLASGLLGLVMVGIVILSTRFHVNPDNIATPLAASLGDLVTLSSLTAVAQPLYKLMHPQPWVAPVVALSFIVLIGPWAKRKLDDSPVSSILYARWPWVSVLSAMVLSSLAGVILERFVSQFAGLAVLAPIINGIGGNLGAVLASKISTSLHTQSKFVASRSLVIHTLIWLTAARRRENLTRTAQVLFSLVIPISIFFLMIVNLLGVGHTSMTIFFINGYLLAAMLQVLLLLVLTRKLVKFIWNCKQDPDNIAIPLVTACGDLLGTCCLTICFLLLFSLGDRDADVGD
eukprot:m.118819 g.118819  ORF g.118819 m.118819 type:complete len:470 (+) comp9534_c0_seq6:107-1516(+)